MAGVVARTEGLLCPPANRSGDEITCFVGLHLGAFFFNTLTRTGIGTGTWSQRLRRLLVEAESDYDHGSHFLSAAGRCQYFSTVEATTRPDGMPTTKPPSHEASGGSVVGIPSGLVVRSILL